ncbi:hypothetical protein [Clostridium sp. LP20]|uniref:hypothetical protein n=1 Tax=Clostridium sp. LP20 TaxID=3418665 RepID=UPI003EE6EECF
MSKFIIEEEATKAKANTASTAMENIRNTLINAERFINSAIELINEDEELGNLYFPSQRGFYDGLADKILDLRRFGDICYFYDREVDGPFTKNYEQVVDMVSNIKSDEITIPNNIGATKTEYYR